MNKNNYLILALTISIAMLIYGIKSKLNYKKDSNFDIKINFDEMNEVNQLIYGGIIGVLFSLYFLFF